MKLNLRALDAFRAVLAEGTVTAAAERVHRTQPVVSRLIAGLESSVGFALFRRKGRRLLPTPEGLNFYHETARAFAALSEIESTARDIREQREIPLRILAQPHIVEGLFPVALGDFCARHRAFRFSIEIRQQEYISHWIANRQFDVGFAPRPESHPQVDSELLVWAPLFVVLPSGHRLSRRRHIRVADMIGEPLVTTRPGASLRVRLEGLFAAAGATPLIRGETTTAFSVCQLVAKGVGVALVDPFVASLFAADPAIAIRPLSPRVELEYLVLRPVGYEPGPVAREFIVAVKRAAENRIDAILQHVARAPRAKHYQRMSSRLTGAMRPTSDSRRYRVRGPQ